MNVEDIGRYAAYAALTLALLGLPLIGISNSECRFDGRAYAGGISEPGNTGGLLAFTLAPLLAIAALIMLVRARRANQDPSRLTITALILVFPLSVVNFAVFFVKGAFACGL